MLIETIRSREVDEVVIEAEFTAICPITKTVDEYKLTLRYSSSSGKYVEFVSFKKYIEGFKGKEILHEELATRIAEDVCSAVQPAVVEVVLQSLFMGMKVTVVKKAKCP